MNATHEINLIQQHNLTFPLNIKTSKSKLLPENNKKIKISNLFHHNPTSTTLKLNSDFNRIITIL